MASVRRRRGVTLIETVLALAILSIVLAGAMLMMNDNADRTSARITAQKLQQVSDAARNYLKYNTEPLMLAFKNGTATSPILVPVARKSASDAVPGGPSGIAGLTSLQGGGFLPSDYLDVNPFGQSHALLIRQPALGRLEAIVTTTGGRLIPDAQLGSIAADAGAEAGFVPAKAVSGSAGRIVGTSGGWGSDTLSWTSSSVGPSQGHAVTAMALDEGAIVADYLYRRDIGIPEANRMRTDLSMGDPAGTKNDINDIRAINDKELNPTKTLEFNVDSFLTMRNGDTQIQMNSAGLTTFGTTAKPNDVKITRDLRVDRHINSTTGDITADLGNVVADKNVTARNGAVTARTDVTAQTGDVTAESDVKAVTGNVEAALDVKGKRFFDIDKGGAYVVDPSETSRFFDLKSDKIDVSTKAYGTSNVDGSRSLGSYLTNDVVLVRGYGAYTNSTSLATAWCPAGYVRIACMGTRAESMMDNCAEEECGPIGTMPVQSGSSQGCQSSSDSEGDRTVVVASCMNNTSGGTGNTPAPISDAGPGDQPVVPSCPGWAPGNYPNCIPQQYPNSCPSWAPGTYPACDTSGGGNGQTIVAGVNSVSCPASKPYMVQCGAAGPDNSFGGQTRTLGYYGTGGPSGWSGGQTGSCTSHRAYEVYDGGKNGSSTYQYATGGGGIAIALCSATANPYFPL